MSKQFTLILFTPEHVSIAGYTDEPMDAKHWFINEINNDPTMKPFVLQRVGRGMYRNIGVSFDIPMWNGEPLTADTENL